MTKRVLEETQDLLPLIWASKKQYCHLNQRYSFRSRCSVPFPSHRYFLKTVTDKYFQKYLIIPLSSSLCTFRLHYSDWLCLIRFGKNSNTKLHCNSPNLQQRPNRKFLREEKKKKNLCCDSCVPAKKVEKNNQNETETSKKQDLHIILRNLNTNNAFGTEPAVCHMHIKAQ